MSESVSKRPRKSNPIDQVFDESESDYNINLDATIKWTIKDFFSKICNDYKTGEKLETPVYTIGPNQELKCRILMYPKGDGLQNKNNKHYFSLYLLVYSKEPKVTVELACYILNIGNKGYFKQERKRNSVQGQSYGFEIIIKPDCLRQMIVLNETSSLTIEYKITVQMSKIYVNKIKVVNDIKTLLKSGNNSDVILEVENTKINVHKQILAARSPVFAAMFKHNMKESNQNIVKIPDIRYAVMKEILFFIYTGEVENLDDSAKDLLAAADKYNLEDLKIMCENTLCKNLNVNNVVEILDFAELYSAVKLKDEASNYIVKNINNLINTPEFVAIEKTQSQLGKVVRILAAQKSS